jgi:hypothetical protein
MADVRVTFIDEDSRYDESGSRPLVSKQGSTFVLENELIPNEVPRANPIRLISDYELVVTIDEETFAGTITYTELSVGKVLFQLRLD